MVFFWELRFLPHLHGVSLSAKEVKLHGTCGYNSVARDKRPVWARLHLAYTSMRVGSSSRRCEVIVRKSLQLHGSVPL